MDFKLNSKFKPMGDQPQAIEALAQGLKDGLANQVLLGVTGSGKTFTMANVIAKVNKPTLVIAHNKTLAAQLAEEFREFFPENRVEFFVSYYDYYQPESYIVATDTYIEKDSSINEEIDKLRHSATSSLFERKDVIVVASVSCIYSLGAPKEYWSMQISLRPNMQISREELIKKLIAINYKRSDIDFKRSTFRVKGDVVDIFPAYTSEKAIRIEFFGDQIDSISEINAINFKKLCFLDHVCILPATHFVQNSENLNEVISQIKSDLAKRVKELNNEGKELEAYRLNQRVNYDCEMISEVGYCSGIENYSRYFDGRMPGQPPYTLLDYFPEDFIMFIDESHMTVPQIRAMYNGDKARKDSLIEYGFRLPSARDNRPLKFDEFLAKQPQTVYVSATPADFELEKANGNVAEQLIRPTGLLDPVIEVRKIDGQIDDLLAEIKLSILQNSRVLVTTLTKKMAETLSSYLTENGIKAKYLHSDVDTLERIKFICSLRSGEFDVLVGINLLREGLDIPEVNLVAILDADKEGFLRSKTSLIQTVGRAARNANAKVIMYADVITDSMKYAIDETARRRKIQQEYNKKHNITPKTIVKDIKNSLKISNITKTGEKLTSKQKLERIELLKEQMYEASKNLDFELAIELREEIKKLKQK